MGLYSIKELEKLSGIKAHTIRVWERRYSVLQPDRTDTNIRLYDDKELKRLINISILNRHGLKISKLVNLSDEEICDKIMHISSDSPRHSDVIESLISAMLDLDEAKFVKIYTNSLLKIGFENTIIEIVFPFLERVGLFWQTGKSNPAQEHFVSHLIRQKILVAIDAIEPFMKPWSRRFVLFLPEGELHELSLLFVYYLLKKHNHHVVYLGQTVPYDDILKIVNTFRPDILLCSVITSMREEEQKDFLKRLSSEARSPKIWFNTRADFGDDIDFELPSNVWLVNKPEQIRDQILKLKYD